MPVALHCKDLLVDEQDAARLWSEVIQVREHADDEVAVSCASEHEMRTLHARYRGKDKPTNVLTFSYEDTSHDIALCLPVAEREAQDLGVQLRDYVALLLVHAFLHATGLDHEKSDKAAAHTKKLEQRVLERAGFAPMAL